MTDAGLTSKAVLRRRRGQLIALLAVFLVPIVIARFYYQHVATSGPVSTTNQGVLIAPARPLGEVDLKSADGGELDARLLLGQWTLIHIVPARCDASCRENLYKTRQVRVALNKDMSRVRRLLVAVDPYVDEDLQALRRSHPDLTFAVRRENNGSAFFQHFEIEGQPAPEEAQRIYLVDPLGNLMMWYPPDQTPAGILTDLRKLLKVSQIG